MICQTLLQEAPPGILQEAASGSGVIGTSIDPPVLPSWRRQVRTRGLLYWVLSGTLGLSSGDFLGRSQRHTSVSPVPIIGLDMWQ